MTISKGLRRWLARSVGAVALAAVLAPAAQASSSIRAFAQRYQYTGRTVSYLIGNQLLNCPTGAAGCTAAQNGSGNNNDYAMVYVDVDGDASTFNSSSATLTFPAGASVLRAYLYWGGDTSASSGGAAAPTPAANNTIEFKAPGGAYQTITAGTLDSTGSRFSGVADVTSIVSAAGGGVYTAANLQAGTGGDRYGGWSLVVIYQDATQPLRSVTLFDGAATVDSGSDITIPVSGFRTPASGLVDARIGLIAFEGDNAYTGDEFQVNGTAIGDALNPPNGGTPTSNVFNSTNTRLGSYQTGRVPQQTNQFGFDVDYISVPAGIINNNDTSASLTFSAPTEVYYPIGLLFVTNVYEPEIVTNFTKTASDVNGGQFRPGDAVDYTINLSNTGDDSSDTTVIRDVVPAGLTYVANSLQIVSGPNAGAMTDAAGDDQADYNPATKTVTFRVGVGATASAGGRITPVPQANSATVVRFRATIDATQANGASLSNVAGVNYVGATSGVAGSGSTAPAAFNVARDADLSITKSGPASVLAGAPISYTLTVDSLGPDSADGARITDNVPGTITGVTISCSASGGAVCPSTTGLTTLAAVAIPTLPAGGQLVFTVNGTAPNAQTTLSNSASIAAPAGTNDPTPANNSAGPVTTTVNANVDLAVSGVLTNTGSVYTGDTVGYTFTVTNNGPGDATGAPVSIPVPPQLAGVTWTCAPAARCGATSGSGAVSLSATLANGASLTISISGTAPSTTPSTIDATTATASAPSGLTDTNTANNSATVPAITVVAHAISATGDSGGPVNGATGGTAVPNVLGNDSVNGAPATTSNVVLSQVSSTQPGVTLDVSTGAVNVAGGTPAGTYTLTYRICEASNPANCTTANVTVTVAAQPIAAVNDASPQVNGATGGTAIANVLGNDTLGAGTATTSNVTISILAPASNPNVTLDPSTGAVIVAAGTPAGAYTITYRICEQLNPTNCATATATANVGSAAIAASNDAGTTGGAAGGVAIASVLANDSLNGGAATTANVTLTQVSTAHPNVTLDPSTGAVNVAPGTPAGSYTVAYQICERLNPTNCTAATAQVTVTAAVLGATADSGSVVGAGGGAAVANVLGNDTFNGATPTLAQVVLTQVSTTNPNVTLDASTGTVSVAPGTPAGTYTLVYRFCEQLNPLNCASATVSVVVTAAVIDAVDDSTPAINGVAGNAAVINVLGNDTLAGAAGTTSNATLVQVSTTHPGITLDPATGNVQVAAGTPAGTYTLAYRLCEQLNPTNCDTASVTVNVVAPALVANDDSATTAQNTAVIVAVLGNDSMAGAAIAAGAVTVTVTTAPAHGTAVVNANGGVTYTPANNYSGPDSFVYRICDVVNPTVCSSATANLTVTANTVDAVDQALRTPQTGPVVIDPLASTRNGGGAPLDPGSVQIVSPPSNGSAVVNPNGTITYTPNTLFFGTETFRYRICDRSTPTPVCDVATVTVTVAMQAPQLRLVKTVPPRAVKAGDLVRYTVVVENTGISPANNATVVDTPPQGFTYVDGSLSVDDGDDAFVLAGTQPIRINGIDVAVGARATIVYVLRVGAGVGRGTHTNSVSATDANGSTVSNTATADVTVEGDPTIDDPLILGTVFLDRNGDGVQQDDEPGLPGVRIVSVEGLVIETDVHGRYHVAGVQPANAMRGSNFVLKVDAATPPPGPPFPTSNPPVRRITPGIPVRFDFGVTLPDGSDATGTATR